MSFKSQLNYLKIWDCAVIEGERIIEDQDVDIIIADKAYDSENFRQEVRNIGAKPVVPRKG